MFKHILLAAGLCLLPFLPAAALPGHSLAETESWVSKHPFLANWMTGGVEFHSNFPFERIAFRQLEDRWFVDLRITFAPPRPDSGLSLQRSETLHETLYLVQKEFIGNRKTEHEKYIDARPWQDVACQDIWSRQNTRAQKLLTDIYSPALARDFASAKLIYRGPFYIPARVGYGHEGHLWHPDKATEADLKQVGMVARVKSEVALYLGAGYAYEVRSDDIARPDDSCVGLKINPRAWGLTTAQTLHHNFKMHAKWQLQPNKPQPNVPSEMPE